MKKAQTASGGWLFKEEPNHYSFHDLQRDGTAVWNGIANPLARQNLRKVKAGDRVLYYHTGQERAIVGEMKVLVGAGPDPDDDDPKAVAVTVKAVREWPRPVTLAQIKADAEFAGWDLLRMSRLSVLAVSADHWKRLERMGGL